MVHVVTATVPIVLLELMIDDRTVRLLPHPPPYLVRASP